MKNESGVPFVARACKLLVEPEPAGPEHRYDGRRQLWLCASTNEPLVTLPKQCGTSRLDASNFGETMLTMTTEGADQSEGKIDTDFVVDLQREPPGISSSQFGETVLTKTQEGADQSERGVGE
jgi:hypothetical protein